MEKAIIYHKVGERFFCPFCGTRTIPALDEVDEGFQICEHLLYIGSIEGGFEYLNPEMKNKIDEEMDEDDLMDLKIDNAIHFSLCNPPPSAFGSYVGYQKSYKS